MFSACSRSIGRRRLTRFARDRNMSNCSCYAAASVAVTGAVARWRLDRSGGQRTERRLSRTSVRRYGPDEVRIELICLGVGHALAVDLPGAARCYVGTGRPREELGDALAALQRFWSHAPRGSAEDVPDDLPLVLLALRRTSQRIRCSWTAVTGTSAVPYVGSENPCGGAASAVMGECRIAAVHHGVLDQGHAPVDPRSVQG